MGFLSKFEGRMEDTLEGAADKMVGSPLSPVKIAKKAEKQMRREKMVGAGKQYAPTLYTVLVSPSDDDKMFGYYPTLAGETETYLSAKAAEDGLVMDGQPLVRFIVDEGLRRGKFDVIAEAVAAPIIVQLREEEMQRYGLSTPGAQGANLAHNQGRQPAPMQTPPHQQGFAAQRYDRRDPFDAAPPEEYAHANDGYEDFSASASSGESGRKPPLPYVPEEELDRSIDYGEYTFNSQDFEDYQQNGLASRSLDETPRHHEPLASALPAIDAAPLGSAQGGAQDFASAASAAPAASAAAINEAVSNLPAPELAGAPNTVAFAGGNAAAADINRPYIQYAKLRDITNEGIYSLANARLVVGRETTCDISIADLNVSRVHCELRYEPQGAWVIGDLGSRNGTFVNGRKVTSAILREGDTITIGMTNLVFTLA